MEKVINSFSPEEIENNHKNYLERLALYEKSGFNHGAAREKVIKQLSDKNKTVLEIGTGKGYLTVMLAQYFDRVVSVDIDNSDRKIAMLNAAYHNQLDKIEFVTADAGELSYPDRSFDAVVSAFTFHHLKLPFKIIREMIRIAHREIVISDFSRKGFEAVERVHRLEGRTHEKKEGDFDIVGVYLREFNLDVRIIEDAWQIIYHACRKQKA